MRSSSLGVESVKRKARPDDVVEYRSIKTRLESHRRPRKDSEDESVDEDDEDDDPIGRRDGRDHGDEDDEDSSEDIPNVDLPKDEMGKYVCPFTLNRPHPVCECPPRKTKGAVNPST